MFCKKCGTKIAEGVCFCPKCGERQEIQKNRELSEVRKQEFRWEKNRKIGFLAVLVIIIIIAIGKGINFILPTVLQYDYIAYAYDKQGRMIKESEYYGSDGELKGGWKEYSYNQNGNIAEKVEYL